MNADQIYCYLSKMKLNLLIGPNSNGYKNKWAAICENLQNRPRVIYAKWK